MQKNDFKIIDYNENSNDELVFYVPQIDPQFIIKLPDNDWIIYIETAQFSFDQYSTHGEYKHKFKIKSLKTLGKENHKIIRNFIFDTFDNYTDENKLTNKLIEIISFFKEEKINIDKKQLIGDLGEALFILECINLNLGKEVLSSLRKNENDNYDFSLENNGSLEIKTTTKKGKQIKIDINQKNAHIIVVELLLKYNGISINEIYDKILSFNLNLPILLKEKIQKYKTLIDKKIIQELCISSYDDVEFGILPNWDFPIIKIEKWNKCKSLLFVMDSITSKLDKDRFDEEIKKMLTIN